MSDENNTSELQKKRNNHLKQVDEHQKTIKGKPPIDKLFHTYIDDKITYDIMYHKHFMDSLVSARIGVIGFLILVSICYHVSYGNKPSTNTFISDKRTLLKVILDSLFCAFIGFISSSIVILIRGGNISKHTMTILTFGIIPGLLNFAQESSGFNRWMAHGTDEYNEIDSILTQKDEEEIKISESGGDPFIISLAYASTIFLGLFVFWNLLKMFYATRMGYLSGENNISDVHYVGFLDNFKYTTFFVELLFIVLINAFAPLISVLIRDECLRSSSYSTVAIMGSWTLILEIMLQYNGLLKV